MLGRSYIVPQSVEVEKRPPVRIHASLGRIQGVLIMAQRGVVRICAALMLRRGGPITRRNIISHVRRETPMVADGASGGDSIASARPKWHVCSGGAREIGSPKGRPAKRLVWGAGARMKLPEARL